MQPLFQTNKIFTSLVIEITNLINENVIITDETGTIVASTEKNRIGQFHEGAFLAMQKKEKMVMTEGLTTKLQGVRAGIVLPVIIENSPYGVLGITGEPTKVEPYGQIVQKMAELFIKGTVDQMTQEKMARNIELFVFDWISGTLSEKTLKERSQFFNINIEEYNQVISLHIPFSTDNLSYKEILLFREYWDKKGTAIFIRWGQGKLLIFDKQYKPETLRKKINVFLQNIHRSFGTDIYVGVGQPYDYTKLSTSFEQAERACYVANKEKKIIFEEELIFEMIQYELNNKKKQKFIERTIGPIQHDDILMDTLNCWLEHHMVVQKTAEALHVHKNTLYYRLEKIEALTKLNVRKIDHLVLFYIGHRFLNENRQS